MQTTASAVSSFSLEKTLKDIREARVTAVELVEKAFTIIKQSELEVQAWAYLNEHGAITRARQLDALPEGERGPLHGLPIGVKDIIDVAGMPTKCGSSLRDDTPATAHAPLVKQLMVLGAVVIGKTVTTEFAYFNPGPTRNPHNLNHTPGGSSSGSAAAIAAGHVPLALGTQTAASVTRPAAYCGISALVATKDLLPAGGVTGLSNSLDTMGLLGSDAAGLQQVFQTLEPTEPTAAAPTKVMTWLPSSEFGVDPDYARVLDESLAGVDDVEVLKIDSLATELISLHELIMAYEAARERATEAAQPEALSAPLNELFAMGNRLREAEYKMATLRVDRLRDEVLALLNENGVIVTPAAQSYAPEGLGATGKPLLSRIWQVLGLPVVVHSGARHVATGMPMGLQLVGAPHRDNSLLAFSQQLPAAN